MACLTSKCLFANLPGSRTSYCGEGITTEEMKELCWLKPKVELQISFIEWTNHFLLRHATFEWAARRQKNLLAPFVK